MDDNNNVQGSDGYFAERLLTEEQQSVEIASTRFRTYDQTATSSEMSDGGFSNDTDTVFYRIDDEKLADKSQETGNDSMKEADQPEQSRLRFLLGCLILTSAVIGGAFIGPMNNLIANKNSWLKNQWAFCLRTIVLVPFVAIEVLL